MSEIVCNKLGNGMYIHLYINGSYIDHARWMSHYNLGRGCVFAPFETKKGPVYFKVSHVEFLKDNKDDLDLVLNVHGDWLENEYRKSS